MATIDLSAQTADYVGVVTLGLANIAQGFLLPYGQTYKFSIYLSGAGKMAYRGVVDGGDITAGANPYWPVDATEHTEAVDGSAIRRGLPHDVFVAGDAGGVQCRYKLEVK